MLLLWDHGTRAQVEAKGCPRLERGDVGERGIGGRPVQKEKRVSILVGGRRPYESAPSTLGSANARAGMVSDGVAWGAWFRGTSWG